MINWTRGFDLYMSTVQRLSTIIIVYFGNIAFRYAAILSENLEFFELFELFELFGIY